MFGTVLGLFGEAYRRARGVLKRVTALLDLAQILGVEREEPALLETLLVDPADVLTFVVSPQERAPEHDLAACPAPVALPLPLREQGGRVLFEDLGLQEAPDLPAGLESE
jgi:hypothetical protein